RSSIHSGNRCSLVLTTIGLYRNMRHPPFIMIWVAIHAGGIHQHGRCECGAQGFLLHRHVYHLPLSESATGLVTLAVACEGVPKAKSAIFLPMTPHVPVSTRQSWRVSQCMPSCTRRSGNPVQACPK